MRALVLLGKHTNVYADVAALLRRPWIAYDALVRAHQFQVIDKLLFRHRTFRLRRRGNASRRCTRSTRLRWGRTCRRFRGRVLRGIVERDAMRCWGFTCPAGGCWRACPSSGGCKRRGEGRGFSIFEFRFSIDGARSGLGGGQLSWKRTVTTARISFSRLVVSLLPVSRNASDAFGVDLHDAHFGFDEFAEVAVGVGDDLGGPIGGVLGGLGQHVDL